MNARLGVTALLIGLALTVPAWADGDCGTGYVLQTTVTYWTDVYGNQLPQDNFECVPAPNSSPAPAAPAASESEPESSASESSTPAPAAPTPAEQLATQVGSELGTALGNAIHQWYVNAQQNAARQAALEQQLRDAFEQQKKVAEQQSDTAQAQRMAALIAKLNSELMLSGTPQLSLMLGDDDNSGPGAGICGLPGLAVGGQRSGCPGAGGTNGPAAPAAANGGSLTESDLVGMIGALPPDQQQRFITLMESGQAALSVPAPGGPTVPAANASAASAGAPAPLPLMVGADANAPAASSAAAPSTPVVAPPAAAAATPPAPAAAAPVPGAGALGQLTTMSASSAAAAAAPTPEAAAAAAGAGFDRPVTPADLPSAGGSPPPAPSAGAPCAAGTTDGAVNLRCAGTLTVNPERIGDVPAASPTPRVPVAAAQPASASSAGAWPGPADPNPPLRNPLDDRATVAHVIATHAQPDWRFDVACSSEFSPPMLARYQSDQAFYRQVDAAVGELTAQVAAALAQADAGAERQAYDAMVSGMDRLATAHPGQVLRTDSGAYTFSPEVSPQVTAIEDGVMAREADAMTAAQTNATASLKEQCSRLTADDLAVAQAADATRSGDLLGMFNSPGMQRVFLDSMLEDRSMLLQEYAPQLTGRYRADAQFRARVDQSLNLAEIPIEQDEAKQLQAIFAQSLSATEAALNQARASGLLTDGAPLEQQEVANPRLEANLDLARSQILQREQSQLNALYASTGQQLDQADKNALAAFAHP